MICMSFVVLAFLPVSPEEVGLTPSSHGPNQTPNLGPTSDLMVADGQLGDDQPVLSDDKRSSGESDYPDKALSFCDAWMIPGVLNFAICLFFVKVSSFVFLACDVPLERESMSSPPFQIPVAFSARHLHFPFLASFLSALCLPVHWR